MGRWFGFLIAIAFGIGLGLAYGWYINPRETTETTLATLRIDYKTDYVLMVAEGFQKDHDIHNAMDHLELLGVLPVDATIIKAIEFSQQQGYTELEIAMMQALLNAVRTMKPAQGAATP